MFSQSNATVSCLWVYNTNCKKSKQILVPPRSFHSLSVRLSGTVVITHNGKTLCSKPGSITFMPANTEYLTETKEDTDILVIHFTTIQNYSNLVPFCIDANNDKTVNNMFSELLNNYHSGKENDYTCISSLYSILATIQKILISPKQKLIPKRMRLAKNFIDKNYTENISVKQLAQNAAVSEVHFRNEFKKYFGVSPLTYIKKVRIDNAKLLLRSGYLTVSEVALSCGFDSISYFSYEFHRLTGMTPVEYMTNKL